MLIKKIVGIAFAASVTLGAGLAVADDMTASWSMMQESVRVAELCRGITHDRAAWAKMGPIIDAKVNHEIGGGERLTLVEAAKSDARMLVNAKGCASDDAQNLLKSYDEMMAQ
jgi:mannitol/fructose-specific phosphotransferase system IIA component